MPQYEIQRQSYAINNQHLSSILVLLPKQNLTKEMGICPNMIFDVEVMR